MVSDYPSSCRYESLSDDNDDYMMAQGALREMALGLYSLSGVTENLHNRDYPTLLAEMNALARSLQTVARTLGIDIDGYLD